MIALLKKLKFPDLPYAPYLYREVFNVFFLASIFSLQGFFSKVIFSKFWDIFNMFFDAKNFLFQKVKILLS